MTAASPFQNTEVWVLPNAQIWDRASVTPVLKQRLPRRAKHLQGILEATRDFACTTLLAMQSPEPFDLPQRSPWIAIVGDDTFAAVGPAGFHEASIRAALADCRMVAIVAAEAIPLPYNMAATCAARDRRNTAVIETRPDQKDAWLTLIKEVSPSASVLLCMPEEAGQ